MEKALLLRLFAILFSLIFVLSGCGQMGDLYLPDKDKVNSGSTVIASGAMISGSDVARTSLDKK